MGSLEFDGHSCWVLADGLGGQGGGEVASRLAIETVLKSFRANPLAEPDAVEAHMRSANLAIRRQQAAGGPSQMASTLVVLVADERNACWAHIGDSRLYLLQSGRLVRQTQDHSVPGALAAGGKLRLDEIRFHKDRNKLLRSLGADDDIGAPIDTRVLCQGDTFLLASDGFWEYIPELAMEIDFAKSAAPGDWLDFMTTRLLNAAEESHDNYSAIAVAFQSATAPMPVNGSTAPGQPEPSDKNAVTPITAIAASVLFLAVATAMSVWPREVLSSYEHFMNHLTNGLMHVIGLNKQTVSKPSRR